MGRSPYLSAALGLLPLLASALPQPEPDSGISIGVGPLGGAASSSAKPTSTSSNAGAGDVNPGLPGIPLLTGALGSPTSSHIVAASPPPTSSSSSSSSSSSGFKTFNPNGIQTHGPAVVPTPFVKPYCVYEDSFFSWHYGVRLDANAAYVKPDCAGNFIHAMQNRGIAVTFWYCQPYDANGKQVALSDPTAHYVALTFQTPVGVSNEVEAAMGDASGGKITLGPCDPVEYDADADVDAEPGESEEEEPGEEGEGDGDEGGSGGEGEGEGGTGSGGVAPAGGEGGEGAEPP